MVAKLLASDRLNDLLIAEHAEAIADCIAWHREKLRCPFYSARFYSADKQYNAAACDVALPPVATPSVDVVSQALVDHRRLAFAHLIGEKQTQYVATPSDNATPMPFRLQVYGGEWSKIVSRKAKIVVKRRRKSAGVKRLAGYSANVVAMLNNGQRDYKRHILDAEMLTYDLRDVLGVMPHPQTLGLGSKLAKLTPQTSDETVDVLPVWSLELFAKETTARKLDSDEQREQFRLERKASKARKTPGSGKSGLAKVYGGESKYAALEAFQFGAVWALSNNVPVWTHSDVATREPVVNKLVWRRGWFDVVDAYRADYRALCKDGKRQSGLAFVRQLGVGMPDENELDSLLRQYVADDLIATAKLLASGMTHREAALKLGVSHTTVATRAKTIARQLLA